MNKILHIFIILLALSLTLGAVSAEDNATDDAIIASDAPAVAEAPADQAVESQDSLHAAGGDEVTTPKADIGVEVTEVEDYGDFIIWDVLAYNLGPNVAEDTQVFVHLSDNLAYLMDAQLVDDFFMPITANYGIWYLGDFAPNTFTEMLIATKTLDDGPFYVEAFAISSTEDPDWSNNYDIAYARADSTPVEADTLPEAGNPIAVALLGLMAIGVGGLRRKV
ncbi:hypothetical protein [Methanobrevibacter sp.]|uniref:hypothetical protein n=1 Tax=Methanobrevibacter sp. TaxID=66852 RepID=UPI00388DFECD